MPNINLHSKFFALNKHQQKVNNANAKNCPTKMEVKIQHDGTSLNPQRNTNDNLIFSASMHQDETA